MWRAVGGSRVQVLPRFALSNNGNGRRPARRTFSSSPTTPSEAEKKTAKTLSWMSAQVSIHGEHAANEWASRLSPAAQRELTGLMVSSPHAANTVFAVPEPSTRDLRLVAFTQSIPFVGFGIMDNSLLIVAGDIIDTSLGVALGISTMCAAAIGNIVSDVAGVMLGAIIEDYASRLGLPVPQLSIAQRQLRSVRFANQFGCAVGLVIGCIIGMFPLLLIDSNKIQKMKQEAKLDLIFSDVVTKAKELIGAEITNLYLIVDSKDTTTPTQSKLTSIEDATAKQQYFYSKHGHPIHIPVGRGVITRAAISGEIENIQNALSEPDIAKEEWQKAFPNVEIRSLVCVPVFDSRGRVIAILQAINKVKRGLTRRDSVHTTDAGFTKTDESILKVLATHIAVSLQNMYEPDVELSLNETIDILKEQGLAGLHEQRQFISLPASPLESRPSAQARRERSEANVG